MHTHMSIYLAVFLSQPDRMLTHIRLTPHGSGGHMLVHGPLGRGRGLGRACGQSE